LSIIGVHVLQGQCKMLTDILSGNTLVSMFKRHGMTQVEYDFIRTYVSAMRRDYYLLRSVLTMMNPSDLGIKSVTEATQLALKAAALHDVFEQKLGDIDQTNYHKKQVADDPPPSAMADLFSLSFFTVAVTTASPNSPANGLFSGEPGTLADMIQQLQQENDKLKDSDAMTQFLSLLKMFSKSTDNKSAFEFWSTVADMFKNGAGLAHYGNYGQAYEDGYGEYEEEQDYDDDYDEDEDNDDYADYDDDYAD
jgi:hypothetical protein